MLYYYAVVSIETGEFIGYFVSKANRWNGVHATTPWGEKVFFTD